MNSTNDLLSQSILFEKPSLKKRFGETYVQYGKSVSRWIQRLAHYLRIIFTNHSIIPANFICRGDIFNRLIKVVQMSLLKSLPIFLVTLFLVPTSSYAEIKTFTHSVKQLFSGSQSPDDARIAAMVKVKREVLEKAGTYLETLTVVKDFEVEKDEILAIAAGVLKAEIVSQKNYASEDAFGIIIEAKVEVDTSILDKRIEALIQDSSLLDAYKDGQRHEKKLLLRIKQLEKENKELRNLSRKEQQRKREALKTNYKNVIQALTASELNKKALSLREYGKYIDPDKALEHLNEAIRIDSNYAIAHNNRGTVWILKGNYDYAISDFNIAIELDPSYAGAYVNRGFVWGEAKGNYDRAISDYKKALELEPDEVTYNNLAWLYATAKDTTYRNGSKAVANAKKAIDKKRSWETLHTMAAAYAEIRDFKNAVSTLKEALNLCTDSNTKKELKELIEAYKAEKTWVQYKSGE